MKMSNYLLLEFRNAGLYPLRNRKGELTKDKILDINGRRERDFEFVEPITIHQISNLLHVLFGERPKPIHRETVYPKQDYLFDKAAKSYLRIDSYKDERGDYYRQTTQTKKALHNSKLPESPIYWERVRLYLEDTFDYFVDSLKEIFGPNVQNITFANLVPMIKSSNDTRITKLFQHLKENGYTALCTYIFGSAKNSKSDINACSRTRLSVINGLDRIIKLDGRIIVPISDEDEVKIRNNRGCGTLLDGGMVFIKGIASGNTVSVHDYTLVGEISLEQKN